MKSPKAHDRTTLVTPAGQVPFGIFPTTLDHINGLDADYRDPMGRRRTRWSRRLHYKQFQYFGIISNDLLAGCALVDTGWLGMAFAYVYDSRRDVLVERTWRSPLGRHLEMSDSPRHGTSRFRHRDLTIEMAYQPCADGLKKTLVLDSAPLSIHAQMLESDSYQPMSLCTRAGINGWVYANKVAGVGVSGEVCCGKVRKQLTPDTCFGHHDFSAGYMRRETFWNWACLSANIRGQQVGLNLSCGVNETSFSENCLWLDGQLHKISGTNFIYNPRDLMAPWRIRSTDHRVDLHFTPRERHREHMDLKLFASNFSQLFGQFTGVLHTPEGEPVSVDNAWGFVEEQYAKW